jgi:hypothetical protein
MKAAVWLKHNYCDVYTRKTKDEMEGCKEEVDHVLEIQLLQHAAAATNLYTNDPMLLNFRRVVNSTLNLNVTTMEINQAKKGPFTAALNRLNNINGGGLQGLSVAELARNGDKWKLGDGDDIWDNIEGQIVVSFDEMKAMLKEDPIMTREQTKIMKAVVGSLQETIGKLQIW